VIFATAAESLDSTATASGVIAIAWPRRMSKRTRSGDVPPGSNPRSAATWYSLSCSVYASSSGPRRGSTFEIRLPLTDREDEPSIPQQQRKAPQRRILVVDDNEDAATSLAMILALEGHEVETVHASHDALERAPLFKPDVAVLDIGLPGMDGFELARRLRENPALEGIRLVALTGYGQAEDRERARAAGFDDHLIKPADSRALDQVLMTASAVKS